MAEGVDLIALNVRDCTVGTGCHVTAEKLDGEHVARAERRDWCRRWFVTGCALLEDEAKLAPLRGKKVNGPTGESSEGDRREHGDWPRGGLLRLVRDQVRRAEVDRGSGAG